MRSLQRTRFALEEIKSHCNETGATPLIKSYFANYLAVIFYAETEQLLRKIMEDRLSSLGDAKVESFVNYGAGSFFNRVKKKELNDLLKMFGCGEGDLLAEEVSEVDVQLYSAIITDRHTTSHGTGSNVTIEQIEVATPCAERLFDAFERIIK